MNRKQSSTYVSPALYKKILDSVPVPCVDAVIVNGEKFLLGKRANQPAKGKWWLIGGRIHKGETLVRAVKRKAREETGRTIRSVKFLDNTETIFRNSHFRGVTSHTVNSIFVVRVSTTKFKNDEQHSVLRWFTTVDPRWGTYVKNMLLKAGFSSSRTKVQR